MRQSYKLLLAAALLSSPTIHAQVKIGNNPATINSDAILEMETTNKAMLLPRIALTSTISASPLGAHTTGMFVFNTATANDVTPGVYYNYNSRWIRLSDTTIYNGDGKLTGNRVVTLNGFNLSFNGTGNVAIGPTGNSAPTSKLDVNGSVAFPTRIVNSGTTAALGSNDYSLIIDPLLTSSTFSVTLPTGTTQPDRIYNIVNQSNTPKVVSTYYDLAGNPQTTIPAQSSITIQANALGNWIETASSYLNNPFYVPGTLYDAYEAIGTTEQKVDSNATKDIPGVTVTFTLTHPGKAIITATAIGAPSTVNPTGPAGGNTQGVARIIVDDTSRSEALVSGTIVSSAQRLPRPTTFSTVYSLAAGTHTIKLEASSWYGNMAYNATPSAYFTTAPSTTSASLKSRILVQVFNQ